MSSSSVSPSTTSRTLFLSLSIHTLLEISRGRGSSWDSSFEAIEGSLTEATEGSRDRREAENRPKSSSNSDGSIFNSSAMLARLHSRSQGICISLCIPQYFCICISCKSKARRVFQIRVSIQDGLALSAGQSFYPYGFSVSPLPILLESSIRNLTDEYGWWVSIGKAGPTWISNRIIIRPEATRLILFA